MQWYGVGLAFQITVMAVVGVLAKIRAPFAHTSLELVKLRYGRAGHGIYIGLCLALNIISCASMILTGSQLVYGMTGMHIAAATILLPFGGVLIIEISLLSLGTDVPLSCHIYSGGWA
jgi:Na+/proline symporter